MALLLAGLGLAASCADFERGEASPAAARDAAPVQGDAAIDAGETGGEVSPAATLSFARDVHPILLAACARCHSASGEASRSALLLVGEAAADRAQVLALVDLGNPAGSRLLTKAAGMGHTGGAILAAGTPEHRTILDWIRQGSAP
jgi:hypothetical protein